MDQRPIGVFDSGLGGLTAVRELRARLPGEDIVYFGDTGRVPYGNRSHKTILKYARQAVELLRRHDCKALLAACGTVSATVLDQLDGVLGVVRPAAQKALAVTRGGPVGVIATAASIASGAYQRALPGVTVLAKACPLLVPLVENGRFRPGDTAAEMITAEYLAPLKEAGVDTLVLGCTHYPLLQDIIRNCLGPEVALVHAGEQAAIDLTRRLQAEGGLSGRESGGGLRLLISDNIHGFSQLASLLLEKDIQDMVEMVDIDDMM